MKRQTGINEHRLQLISAREALVNSFIRITELKGVPKELILDPDATDDQIHGNQEGKFFNAYYNNYCYLPLYIFCNGHPLCAKLRRSCIDGVQVQLKNLISSLPGYEPASPK